MPLLITRSQRDHTVLTVHYLMKGGETMKYTKPELIATGSALGLVQMQTAGSKGPGFVDRADLQIDGPVNTVADPAAYEADE